MSTLRIDRHGWIYQVVAESASLVESANVAGLATAQKAAQDSARPEADQDAATSQAYQGSATTVNGNIADTAAELNIRHCPSPNHDERVDKEAPYLLVIHNISLPPYVFGGPYIEQLFTNSLEVDHHPFFKEIQRLRVSAHFLIRRDGEIVQFVSTDKRAWHAGVSSFEGREVCNNFSIGIEMEGSDYAPYEAAQYTALAQLSALLRQHYTLRAVRGHEHIAPVRKTDPGPYFDWTRYRREAGWTWRELPGLGK